MSAVSKDREKRAAGAERDSVVEYALGLDQVSTHWQVELRPAQAREFLRRASAYNNFTAEDLMRLVDRVNTLVPPMAMGADNPNTGHPHHRFLIGNEGSRVIYLKVIKTYMATAFDYDDLAKQLEIIGKACQADETDIETNDGLRFEFRFWWD